tara:strand:- start:1004 stop:2320 length:1317 start_codon:yes stop_codon:yes gene_type:complete
VNLFRSKNNTKIPPLIVKNTLLFAVSQAFQGIPMQLAVTTGASMVAFLTGSKALAGIPGMLISGSRFLVAFPTGFITDKYGRKKGMYISLILGLISCSILSFATSISSVSIMFLGFAILGLGFGANTQLRVAAGDMYPVKLRASGIGTVLTFSVFGAFLTPLLISLVNLDCINFFVFDICLTDLNLDEYDELTKIWGFVPFFLLPIFIFIFAIKPDPIDVAKNLEKYWGKNYASPDKKNNINSSEFKFKKIFNDKVNLAAFLSYSVAQSMMVMVMFLTSLIMVEKGYDYLAVSLTVSIHVVGMFAFSSLVGIVTDTIGRKKVSIIGMFILALGCFITPLTSNYYVITLGLFFIGLGWSGSNVASTSMIADRNPVEQRGRVTGLNDMSSGAFSVLFTLIGPIIANFTSLAIICYIATIVSLVPILLLLSLEETKPGQFK